MEEGTMVAEVGDVSPAMAEKRSAGANAGPQGLLCPGPGGS